MVKSRLQQQQFMLIDSHAHLTNPSMIKEGNGVFERALAVGIEAIVNICTCPEEVEQGFDLSKRYPWIYAAASNNAS